MVNGALFGVVFNGLFDVLKGLDRVFDRVQLVHHKDDGGNAKQLGKQGMATGLGQEFKLAALPLQFGGVHQDHRTVRTGGGGDHVAGVLLMSWRVANDEFALFGGEVTVGHIDGDALLTLGREAVGQQGQIGLSLSLNPCQMVF